MLRVGCDVAVQGTAEPTGVERAQATLLDALAALPAGTVQLVRLGPDEPAGPGAPARRLARMPVALWRETVLPRRLAAERVDVLHSPVTAVPLRAPCPVVATVHELPRALRRGGPSGGDRSLRHRAATALAACVAARLVCVSERTRAELCARHPAAASRAVVVPNAVHPRFAPAPDGAAPRRGDAPYVLAVGRLRAKKNLAALLEAFARSRHAAGHRLVLAGPDGDAADALRARARRADLAGRVDFAGHVDEARLLALYRGAALLAFPSLFEGFGLPVLEAMACGTPVLASVQGATEEVRGDATEPCDARDPDTIARGLDAVLGDAVRAEALRARGRLHAARFSAEATARALLAVLEDAARATASRPAGVRP